MTEGDTVYEALANVEDAFAAAEIYEYRGRPLPGGTKVDNAKGPVFVEPVVSVQ